MPGDKNNLGYGRPPRQSRFRKGESGNPGGRPKGAKNFRTELIQELNSTVPVTENGKRRKLTKRKVIAKNMVNKGLAGEIKVIPMLLNAERSGQEDLAGAGTEYPVASDDEAVMKDIIRRILAAHTPE